MFSQIAVSALLDIMQQESRYQMQTVKAARRTVIWLSGQAAGSSGEWLEKGT